MEERLGLRLRIFLLFVLLAGAILAAVAVGLVLGYRYAGQSDTLNGFVAAGIVAGFGILGLTVLVWLLFDENVAKPIQQLASQLRARAHAGAGQVADLEARYLGDLGPAARAVAERLGMAEDGQLDDATAARLQAEREWLTALLSEIPVAVVLASTSGRIVLYDAQARDILAQVAPPRLGASIADYLDRATLDSARAEAAETGGEVTVDCPGTRATSRSACG